MSALDAAAAAAGFRLPTEPYPGLRPFRDHESLLLFGRMRQITEIIEHLRSNQFVAVIGGSGSGKSSLINAGVVPELRSFGIRGAGDFWIPMVCSPGTTPGEGERDDVTPITRFAWKFARLLKSRGSEAEDAARVDEIAACLRQDAGFALLADTYVSELAVPPGPDPQDARLLFVIDQFEELFHPSNKDSEDASLLVERVIDHFFSPHKRCFVVLTMRSEHLSDCAGYLELPDAINKASYLVRRLDEDELREAITAPAQRFLRLLQRQASLARSDAEGDRLPAAVAFDEQVLDRLLRDVQAITHDPDHLPLLQHLLARIWETACRREEVPAGGVPASILPADLARAVSAGSDSARTLDDKVNVLRASVDNWAEAIFARRSHVQQTRMESLLRQLAFKEPNTGMYSQRRVNVDDPKLFGHDPARSTRSALWELIEDPERSRGGQFGFIGSVDYLFWDDEDPRRVTLKVSHESFIRGWMRFRTLVDKEAERFDAFVDLLRRCSRWSGAKRPDRLLLEPADLDRINDERLQAVFADQHERAAWFKVLMLDRDGPRLAQYGAEIDEFIAQSRERQRAEALAREEKEVLTRDAIERERLAEARMAVEAKLAAAEILQAKRVNNRNIWLGLMAFGLALALVPSTLFFVRIQIPVMRSLDNFASARMIAERNMSSGDTPAREENQRKLKKMLDAADLIESGKKAGAFRPDSGLDQLLLDFAQGLPMGDAKMLVAKSTSEPVVNGGLRALLTKSVWRSDVDPSKLPAGAVLPPLRKDFECAVMPLSGQKAEKRSGSLLLDGESRHGIFVPAPENNPEFTLYAASYIDGSCSAGRILWSVPRYLKPAMLFDARVRYMALVADGPSGSDPSVSIYLIDWEPAVAGQPPAAHLQFGWVVPDSDVVRLIRNESGGSSGQKVAAIQGAPTWRESGGIGVSVADVSWRIFSPGAQLITSAENEWVRLDKAAAGSQCERLERALHHNHRKGESDMYQAGAHCFEILHGDMSSAVAKDSAQNGAPRNEVLVAVYDEPLPKTILDREQPPPSIASIAFGRLAPGSYDWVVGKPGRYEGWIALQGAGPAGKAQYDGVPWSTDALRRLGQQVKMPASAAAAVVAHNADAAPAAPPRP